MDNISKLKDMLLELPEIKSAQHIKSVESAVTTAWGEEAWDHQKLSRDCLQNAVDGCVESNIDIDKIKITTDNDQIKVFAPNEYSLEKLYYLGSTKSEKDRGPDLLIRFFKSTANMPLVCCLKHQMPTG